jgi:uncharacterized protein YjiK
MIMGMLPVTLLAATTSVLDRFSLDSNSMMQWRLPDRLNEISGLAITPDGRLLAVDDEVAVVYELDYDDGKLIKAFALGKPVIKGDFEGIAVADGLVYLTTSSGRLYFAAEGADGQRVTFDNYDTGLGTFCDIEGLVQGTDNTRLYFLCKRVRKNSGIEGLSLFAWDIVGRRLLPDESIVLPEEKIMRQLRIDRFSPSGITIDRNTGNRIIVASRQRVLAEVTADGKLVATRHLEARHKQAEGIELTIDGRLLIADEGGSRRARLAVYQQDGVDENNND